MANHKSARKRSRQTIKRNQINKPILSKVKSSISSFNSLVADKDNVALKETFSALNSALSRAVKRGLIKKQYVARKLSSLSIKLKNIS